MNKQEISNVLAELYKITGFRVSLHGAHYEEIAAYPEDKLAFCKCIQSKPDELAECIKCDRAACERALKFGETEIYKCRFGLVEAVSPLYSFGVLTGFLMMGQVSTSEEDLKRSAQLLQITCETENAEDYVANIPLVDDSTVRSYVNIMTICAKYLTVSNAIVGQNPTVAEQARKYIDENLNKKLLIGDICEKLKCSKSTLLTTFKRRFGTTVNNYITDARLNMAISLLGDGDLTISEISAKTGFSDQSYFSKVFSARYGIPPSEYRTGN